MFGLGGLAWVKESLIFTVRKEAGIIGPVCRCCCCCRFFCFFCFFCRVLVPFLNLAFFQVPPHTQRDVLYDAVRVMYDVPYPRRRDQCFAVLLWCLRRLSRPYVTMPRFFGTGVNYRERFS